MFLDLATLPLSKRFMYEEIKHQPFFDSEEEGIIQQSYMGCDTFIHCTKIIK